jgi:predicted alpha/beta-hydrolase family hydrolase
VRVVLGPGAMAGPESLGRHLRGLRARGVEAEAVALPRGRAERAAPVFAELAGPDVIAGGHSFGGRAASLAAAETTFAGLLMFGFPLSGRGEERTAHFPRVTCPVLILNGEADELTPVDELRERVRLLPNARLITYPGADHRLNGALDRALDEAAAFVHGLEAAAG